MQINNFTYFRATASALLKDSVYFTQKLTFSILHHHFYKTPTSVHLLHTIFYINNIYMRERERERERERVNGRENVRGGK